MAICGYDQDLEILANVTCHFETSTDVGVCTTPAWVGVSAKVKTNLRQWDQLTWPTLEFVAWFISSALFLCSSAMFGQRGIGANFTPVVGKAPFTHGEV